MLALVDYEYKRFLSFRRSPGVRHDTVLGLRVIRITAQLRRSGRCGKANAVLQNAGADEVCFSMGFPAKKEFTVREAALSALHPDIMLKICTKWINGGETALITGGADKLSEQLLEELSRKFRYVQTRGLPHGAILRLRQKTGASVIENPAEDKLCEASFAVFTRKGDAARLSDKCTVLAAHEDFVNNVSYSKYIARPMLYVPGDTPEGFDRQLIITQALRRGALSPDNIGIGTCQILTKQPL